MGLPSQLFLINTFSHIIWSKNIKLNENKLSLIISTLKKYDKEEHHLIVNFIQRHKLYFVVLRNKRFKELIPNTYNELIKKKFALRKVFANKIYLLRYLLRILSEAKINVLLIKGFALSYQIEGNLFCRIHCDLDIFVSASDLEKTINLLLIHNFKLVNKFFTKQNNKNMICFYKKFIYELSFDSFNLYSANPIDLHWQLFNLCSKLPSFEEAWKEKEEIAIDKLRFYTLSKKHTFLHACINSAKDKWASLSSLIEIEKLFQKISNDDLNEFRKIRIVRLSAAATYEYSKNEKIARLFDMNSLEHKYARAISEKSLCAELKSKNLLDNFLKNFLLEIFHQLLFVENIQDLIKLYIYLNLKIIKNFISFF